MSRSQSHLTSTTASRCLAKIHGRGMVAEMQHGRLFEYIQYRNGDQHCSREITISYLPVIAKSSRPEEDGVGIMEASRAAPDV